MKEGQEVTKMHKKRIIVGISGASGVIYGIRLLEVLAAVPEIETHLILTGAAKRTLKFETDHSVEYLESLAYKHYRPNDFAAGIASGSFHTAGMIIAPCSVKSLSGIAASYDDNLLLRAADVILKERRRLVIVFRETPLHLGHLRAMTQLTEMGAIVMPPVPAFYHGPTSVRDIVDQSVNRMLDLLDIELPADLFQRWPPADAEDPVSSSL